MESPGVLCGEGSAEDEPEMPLEDKLIVMGGAPVVAATPHQCPPPLPIPTPSICSWMTSDLLNKGKCILGLGGLACKAEKAFDY